MDEHFSPAVVRDNHLPFEHDIEMNKSSCDRLNFGKESALDVEKSTAIECNKEFTNSPTVVLKLVTLQTILCPNRTNNSIYSACCFFFNLL